MPKTTRTTEQENVAEPRPASKSAAMIALLSRPNGAILAELTDATGWQKHTVRAALTGLKKKGHAIERTKAEDGSRYRIVANEASQ
jgi:DNA-binding MarR family transcriptional regulator